MLAVIVAVVVAATLFTMGVLIGVGLAERHLRRRERALRRFGYTRGPGGGRLPR